MKKYLLLILVTCIGIVSSCQYDDDELWGSVDDLANRVSALETLTQQMNGDIAALQAVITAVENRVAISEVEKLTDGYILHFTNGTTATIKHGKDGADGKDGQDGTDGSDGKDGAAGADGEDGKDGADGADGKDGKDGKDAPYIYIAKDNGVYYWTLTVDGKTDWLTDEAGNKIPVTGAAGADGEDGKDGADGTAGSAGTAGTPGTAGAPGRTPSLRITDQGVWEVSYDGQTWTAVPGAANALAQKGDAGASSIFGEVEATEGAVTIKMTDGNEYTLLRLKSLEFYTDAKRTQAVSPKELTWNKDFNTVEYYFNLNLNDAKCEVMTEDGFEAEVSMEKNKVTVTLPQGENPVQARAVILFYNNQQTLTSVFKFKHFESDPNGNIAAVNTVLNMLGTTEELNVQIPALNTSGEDSDQGEVILPVIQGATQEGAGTNLTLNFTEEVTTSSEKPLVIKQVENTSTPDENLESGTSIHNLTVNFSHPVDTLALQTPNSSVTLTGGQKLDGVFALTGENTLYVDSVEINVLKVKGGSVHIFPEGYIKGHIKNDSGKTITIYLEPGATVEKNLPNGFHPEKEKFVIVYVSPKLYVKNKEFAYALSREYPEHVTLGKNGYAEFTPEWANSITFMDFSYKGYTISSLEGIEHFKNLKELIFASVGLTTCDLSRNVNLERVLLMDNNLQSLDFSQNPKLYDLDCTLNKNLKTLNIAHCTKLTRLKVSETALTSVSIYNKAQITALHYGYTDLSFDLSQFPALTSLGCYGHDFHSLNLSAKQKQQMDELQCYYSKVNELDLSEYPNLTFLNAHYNNLKTLNVEAAPKLNYLNCHNNQMKSLDISMLYNLEFLYCGEQKKSEEEPINLSLTLNEQQMVKWTDMWTQPDFAYNLNDNVTTNVVELGTVVIENAELSYALQAKLFDYEITLNEQGFAVMKMADVLSITGLNLNYHYYDPYTVTSLKGIENFKNLQVLTCENLGLVEADLSKNTRLQRLYMRNNRSLEKLDISGCEELFMIDVTYAGLASLDITHPEKIESLQYGYTSISLDLSKFTNLDLLACEGKGLSSLDLPKSSKDKLSQLLISENNFTSFNVSEYPNLWSFHCGYNQLTSLDLSQSAKLEFLSCEGNNIETLDISHTIIGNPDYTLICGPQRDNIPLILILTPEQKAVWDANNWSQRNQNVYFEGDDPMGIITFENEGLSAALYQLLGADKVSLNASGFAEMKKMDVWGITNLDFGWSNEIDSITSLDGIEHFKNLQTLWIMNNPLNDCDLKQNKALRGVYLCNVECETLDFSNLTELTDLACAHSTVLKKIILDGCNKLTHLECQNTSITELNIPKPEIMNNLIYGGKVGLTVDYNQFTSLTSLGIQHAGLTELVLPDFLKQQLTTLMLNNENHLTSLNLEEYPNLVSLSCDDNDLTSLDISKAPKLQYLSCTNNYIPSLDIRQNELINLNCGNQKNRINMVLTLTDAQKTLWNKEWSKDWGNERVYFEGEEPAQIEGGTSSGEDFESGGNF